MPAPAGVLELLVADEQERAGRALGVDVPAGWPPEPEAREGLPWHARALRDDPSQLPWRVRLLVLRSENRVVGAVNLKGPPDASGTVEIGWGVAADYRRRGLAVEAVRAVIGWVLQQARVRRVIATIPPGNAASRAVAIRVGMAQTQETKRGLPVWELRDRPGPSGEPTAAAPS